MLRKTLGLLTQLQMNVVHLGPSAWVELFVDQACCSSDNTVTSSKREQYEGINIKTYSGQMFKSFTKPPKSSCLHLKINPVGAIVTKGGDALQML